MEGEQERKTMEKVHVWLDTFNHSDQRIMDQLFMLYGKKPKSTGFGGILFKRSKACPQICPQCSGPLEMDGSQWPMKSQQ